MENLDNDDDVTWGKPKPTLDKEKKHYHSFFYGDEEYCLYDNVFLYDENESEHHIGKIMRLWEDLSCGRKMALIRWFLRPNELPLKLQGPEQSVQNKELFLAFGKGKGVTNENRLECFDGKCKVLCTSKDVRNRQPSKEDLRDADFFFYRMYNVDRMKLSNVDGIADKLGCDVVYNKVGWVSSNTTKRLHERDAGGSGMCKAQSGVSQKTAAGQEVADGGHSEFKRRIRNSGEAPDVEKRAMGFTREHIIPASPWLKRPSLGDDKDGGKHKNSSGASKTKIEEGTWQTYTKTSWPSKDHASKSYPVSSVLESLPEVGGKAAYKVEGEHSLQRGQRQGLGTDAPSMLHETNLGHQSTSSLNPKLGPASSTQYQEKFQQSEDLQYTEMPSANKAWDVNLQQGLLHGKVLLMQNLNTAFTSADIRHLTRSIFRGCSDAQIIPQHTVSPAPYSEALVIFETESLADLALQQLEDKCLVLTASERPLIASKAQISEPGKVARFPGHFPLNNFKLSKKQQNEHTIKGSATSFWAQPNSIEFEMAMEWWSHQNRAHNCWDRLYKVQRDDTSALLQKYKMLT